MTTLSTNTADFEHYEKLLADEGLAPVTTDYLGIPRELITAFGNVAANTSGVEPIGEMAATAVYELRQSGVHVADLDFRMWREVTALLSGPLFSDIPVVPVKKLRDQADLEAAAELEAVESSVDFARAVRDMEPLTDVQRDILSIVTANHDDGTGFDIECTRSALDRITARATGIIASQ